MGAGASSTAHLDAKSIVVAEAAGENGAVRRSKAFPDLKLTAFEDVRTCRDAFLRGVRENRAGPCYGFRPRTGERETTNAKGEKVMEAIFGPFTWMSYGEVEAKVNAVGSAIAHFELAKPNDLGHRCVGIYGKNRWEWSASQQALFRQGGVSVPLYDTLGEAAVSYIVQQTALTSIFCSRAETGKLIAWKTGARSAAAFASLVNVVQFETVTEPEVKAAADAGIRLFSFPGLEAAGKANPKDATPSDPEGLAVICYTSGTTGNPKGAMLSHRVCIADAGNAVTGGLEICAADVHLSYLPLAHVFEQLVQNALYMVGASMGFYQGDTLKILEDITALRPTLFVSVPRLFNRIHDKIRSGVADAGGAKAALFNQGYAAKQYWLKENHLTHRFWDGLVFGKIKARIGLDRCRLMISGSAPLPAHVMEFLRIAFSCRVVEGYGQTECGGACSVTDPADQASLGHVGGPLPSNELKLVSVPDLGYNVTDTIHGREVDKATGAVTKEGIACFGRGEICIRGPNVFAGYYKDPANTAEAIDGEGWLHTGDIGIWDARGQIKIVDRKKNMFKLSQGEYVAAEKVENECLGNYVAALFVHGDSLHSMTVAVAVPNPDAVKAWATAHNKVDAAGNTLPFATLCADPELVKTVLADLQKQGKSRGLQSFEIPKGLILEPVAWTPDDILTPSFKLKRRDAKEKYGAQLDALYAKLETVAGKADLKQGTA